MAPRPTVLLVEDDSDVREMLAAVLSKRFKLFVADSGSRALAIIAGQQIDLLLTDIVMPGDERLRPRRQGRGHASRPARDLHDWLRRDGRQAGASASREAHHQAHPASSSGVGKPRRAGHLTGCGTGAARLVSPKNRVVTAGAVQPNGHRLSLDLRAGRDQAPIGRAGEPMAQESRKLQRQADNRYIGERIRRRRAVLKLTPTQLGRRLGVTSETVRQYEAGRRSLDAVGLWRMSRALHIDVEYLVRALLKESPPEVLAKGGRRPAHVA
jgi:CheY-like chemotaxis protein/DNA-binding transcriptional regulator YiaG